MPRIDWELARLHSKANEAVLEREPGGTAEQIAQVYAERAKRLAVADSHDSVPAGALPTLIFLIDNERYGLELASVASVLRGLRATPIPESPPHLDGVLNVNGEIRPALNLRFLLGLPTGGRNSPCDVLLLRRNGREAGILVDRLEQVKWISPPQTRLDGGTESRFISGFAPDSVILLRPSALFAELWEEELET